MKNVFLFPIRKYFNRKSYFIFGLLFILSINIIYAQIKAVKFDRFSTRDGLSQNRVFDIVQDNLGFIWIGTEDGLNRYDGYEFKVYKNMPGDSTSLNSNFVQTIHISQKGDLWLGGDLAGLNKYNFENETFMNFKNNHFDQRTIISNDIRDISEDKKGNLWVATYDRGFDYLEVSTNTFYHMANMLHQGYSFNNQFLRFIHQDKAGRLWVGGQGKLHLFKVGYHENGIPKLQPLTIKIEGNRIDATSIEETDNGEIWIGTANQGLFHFDENKNLLAVFEISSDKIDLRKMIISTIETDKSGYLWFGGLYSENGHDISFDKGFGLLKLDLKSKRILQFNNDPNDIESISSGNITSLLVDRTGVLWAGTDLAGINKYDNSVIKFNLYKPSTQITSSLMVDPARGFYVDSKNNLWIATALGGLLKYARSENSYRHFVFNPARPNSISSNLTKCIYDDGTYFWIGTFSGLNRFNPKTGVFKRIYLDPSQAYSYSIERDLSINSINYNIIEIDTMPGYLWYGSNSGGLVRFNKKDFTFKNYTYDPETENSFNNRDNYVRTVFYSNSFPHEIWAGTTHGINIFNIETERFRYYTHDSKKPNGLSNDNIMQLYEDDQGYIWISTYGGGLNRLDPKTEDFVHFTEANSDIPNNAVYGVLPDEQGNLWMSTNNGISKFNPKTFEFRNYTVDDGLQGEEYNGGALYKSPDGEMFFGGIDGFNSFFPEDVVDNPIKPAIVLTNLKIFNESVKAGAEDSPLKRPIYNTNEIVLSYWQNDISFEYVALHYANSPKNKYAFKLENYEEKWRYVDNIRIATYTNLDPGEYIFQVKGSNSDGLWNNAGTSIKLTVLPPWWRTWWAYFGYILLAGLTILGFDRIQRARVRAKEKHRAEMAILEAENKRKSEELEEARQLQLSMLPKELPKLPHLDIAVYMQTATEVGGDYYDFSVKDDGSLNIAIGDATGHGMKAGIMVSSMKSIFTTNASEMAIEDFFTTANRGVKSMRLKRMMMGFAMLNINKYNLKLINAGMPPVFLYRKKTATVEEITEHGMPIGAMNHSKYNVNEKLLEKGDVLFLLSDGMPELQNEKGEMYGYERIREKFKEITPKMPKEIMKHLKNVAEDWGKGKEPDDDVTFVVIQMKA